MKIGALFSGGKDSTFALHWAHLQGWDVRCLLTLRSQRDDSWMFHTPNIDFVKDQAKALQIPLVMKETKGEKEKELEDLRVLLQDAKEKFGIRGIVTGAIASEYQRMRINMICHELDLKAFSPLWHKKPEEYLYEITRAGYSFVLSQVAAEGLTQEFLGKEVTKDSVAWFLEHCRKHSIHPAGEGGEYESFVVDGPLFKTPITITEAEKHWDKTRGTYALRKVMHENQ